VLLPEYGGTKINFDDKVSFIVINKIKYINRTN